MKNCNMILSQNWQKLYHYHQAKFTDEEILPSDQSRMMGENNFIILIMKKHLKNKQKVTDDQGR